MSVFKLVPLFSDVMLLSCGLELQNNLATVDCPIYVIDDCWPLNRQSNLDGLEVLRRRWPNLKVITNPKNLGIHEGLNYACSQLPLVAGDILVISAPDSVPLQKGWDEALVKVLEGHARIAYVGANSYAIDETPGVEWIYRKVNGVGIKIASNRPAMFHTTAWKWDFIKKVGGFTQPCAYYGHIESAMYSRLAEHNMMMAYLCDYNEDFRLQPFHGDLYFAWKQAQAHSGSFKGSFGEWLESRNIT